MRNITATRENEGGEEEYSCRGLAESWNYLNSARVTMKFCCIIWCCLIFVESQTVKSELNNSIIARFSPQKCCAVRKMARWKNIVILRVDCIATFLYVEIFLHDCDDVNLLVIWAVFISGPKFWGSSTPWMQDDNLDVLSMICSSILHFADVIYIYICVWGGGKIVSNICSVLRGFGWGSGLNQYFDIENTLTCTKLYVSKHFFLFFV